MKSVAVFTLATVILLVTACDSTQPKSSGTLTAALVSPNGAEGAAVLDISGVVDSVIAAEGTQLFQTPTATGKRVVLVRLTPGELTMKVNLPDVSTLPSIAVVQVADVDNQLRQPLTGYKVSFK